MESSGRVCLHPASLGLTGTVLVCHPFGIIAAPWGFTGSNWSEAGTVWMHLGWGLARSRGTLGVVCWYQDMAWLWRPWVGNSRAVLRAKEVMSDVLAHKLL